jgi:molybdate transport system substrate-binding protein
MRLLAALTVVLAAAAAGACGADDGPTGGAGQPTEVVVLAAASLTEAFPAVGRAYSDAHPGVRVTFQFAASSVLAQQVADGAPADVLATADEDTMSRAVVGGHAAGPVVVARNRPALLVERGNPKHLAGVADLARPDLVFVACAPEVPCGKVATAVLHAAGVARAPASREENVKAVVAKVTLGEADAGIVYATDAKAVGDNAQAVDIDIAADPALEARYAIALTKRATDNDAAKAWIDHVRSETGRAALADYGFLAP